MELQQGGLPMSDEETDALAALRANANVVGITRRDPDESGPLILEYEDGTTVEVETNG